MTIAQHPMQEKATAAPAPLRAAATYDAAADHFDEAPLGFWDRHGQRAVELLSLRPGSRVLDVGCGTGASALPAAVAVGPQGQVTGIDVSENMLKRARAKAQAQRLRNVTFTLADMAASGQPEEDFDAVISVFSIFFVANMQRQVAELWRMLRPGGELVVTVWGPRAFEPWASIFDEELSQVRPDIPVSPRPWERLTASVNLRSLLLDGGTSEPTIDAVIDRQQVSRPTEWWTIGMGSGYRWQIDQLTPGQRRTVRALVVQRLADMGATLMETNAIHAVARKRL